MVFNFYANYALPNYVTHIKFLINHFLYWVELLSSFNIYPRPSNKNVFRILLLFSTFTLNSGWEPGQRTEFWCLKYGIIFLSYSPKIALDWLVVKCYRNWLWICTACSIILCSSTNIMKYKWLPFHPKFIWLRQDIIIVRPGLIETDQRGPIRRL